MLSLSVSHMIIGYFPPSVYLPYIVMLNSLPVSDANVNKKADSISVIVEHNHFSKETPC